MPPRRVRDLKGTVRLAERSAVPIVSLAALPVATAVAAPKQQTAIDFLRTYVPGLSEEQLLNFERLNLGPHDDRDYTELLYSIIDSFHKKGWDATFGYLEANQGKSQRELIFGLPTLESSREKERIDLALFREKEEASKGIYKCPRCSSRETVSNQKQTRSADEPMTTFIRCVACNFNWRT